MAGKTITRTQRDRRATGLRRVSPRRPRPAAPSLPPGQGQRQGRTQRQLRPGAARYPHPRPCRRADPPEHPTSFPLQFYQRPGSRAGDRRPALTRISPEIARYAGPGSARARLPPRVSFVSSWRLPPAALTPAAPAPGPASLLLLATFTRPRRAAARGSHPRRAVGARGGPRCSSPSPSPSHSRGGVGTGRAWEPRGAPPEGAPSWGPCLCAVQSLSRVRFFATPTGCSTPGFSDLHQLPEFAQTYVHGRKGFPGGSNGKESACNAGDPCSIPGWGRFPGEGNDSSLPSCLVTSMEGEAWRATVCGVPKSRTRLSE